MKKFWAWLKRVLFGIETEEEERDRLLQEEVDDLYMEEDEQVFEPDEEEDRFTEEEEMMGLQSFMWCLDNGHGKYTAGKHSPTFDGEIFYEWEFNRDIVKRIAQRLKTLNIAYYIVVPEKEIGNDLELRVDRANNLETNLEKIFVSIHANAGPAQDIDSWSIGHGVETWHYHGSPEGEELAYTFLQHILKETGWKDRGTKSRPYGQFYVLRKTVMPAVLTENGFYNNPDQVRELMKDEVRERIALAHVNAIIEIEKHGLRYFNV